MPRDVVLHGALLEPTGTQMDKPLDKFTAASAWAGPAASCSVNQSRSTNGTCSRNRVATALDSLTHGRSVAAGGLPVLALPYHT